MILLVAGCSSGQQAAFTVHSGFRSTLPLHTLEPADIGLSTEWLHDETDHSVRITSVRFVDPPRALHMLNVYAYSFKDTNNAGVITQLGVLYKECPAEYKPHVIDSVSFPAHVDAPYFAVLAFTIARPGVYHLDRVRIDYRTDGNAGWQYQNTNTTITVKNPPLPGPKPIPPSGVC
ncbi:MAG TPA: hypothetical protein VFI65_16810 [Streptosporangiaceae bacterium]|nr:hypothetical protein [Streptosporangiaceae bacterium]